MAISRYMTAMAALHAAADDADLDIPEADLVLLRQNKLWSRDDRTRVTNALALCTAGGMRYVGCSPSELPAEFVAAAIWKFCAIRNWQIACDWVASSHQRGLDIARGVTGDRVSRGQMFAMILDIEAGGFDAVEAQRESLISRQGGLVEDL